MKYFSILIIIIGLVLASCSEDDSGMNMAPTVTVSDATDIYRTGATLSSNISNATGRSIKESGFIYSTTSDFANMTMDDIRKSSACVIAKTDEPVASGNMRQSITSLKANTSYYYCSYISSGYSIERSEIKSFTTATETAPIFGELNVSNLTINSCNISFQIIDMGGEDNVQTLELWYQKVTGNTAPSSLDKSKCVIVDATGNSVNLIDLEKNTRYAACAHVITTTGRESTSAVVSFMTENVNVTFGNAFITPGDTYFNVTCTVNSSEEIIGEGVFYSREIESPSENNMRVADANVDKQINVAIEDLSAGTYYVRPYAIVNKNGNTVYVYGNTASVTISGYIEPLAQLSSCTVEDVTSSTITVAAGFTGTPIVKEYGFCYVQSTGTPTITDTTITIANGKPFTATLYALNADTDYTIRAYAITDSGVSYSAPLTQHTLMKTPSSDDNIFPGKN